MRIRMINNDLDYTEVHFVDGLPSDDDDSGVKAMRRMLHFHITGAIPEALEKPIITDGFVSLRVVFFRKRPTSHYRQLQNGHLVVKRSAPCSFDCTMQADMWKMMNIVVRSFQGIIWGTNSHIAQMSALVRWETNYGFGDSFVVQSHRLTEHCVTNLLLSEYRWIANTLEWPVEAQDEDRGI